jgi:hypothetical protein
MKNYRNVYFRIVIYVSCVTQTLKYTPTYTYLQTHARAHILTLIYAPLDTHSGTLLTYTQIDTYYTHTHSLTHVYSHIFSPTLPLTYIHTTSHTSVFSPSLSLTYTFTHTMLSHTNTLIDTQSYTHIQTHHFVCIHTQMHAFSFTHSSKYTHTKSHTNFLSPILAQILIHTSCTHYTH